MDRSLDDSTTLFDEVLSVLNWQVEYFTFIGLNTMPVGCSSLIISSYWHMNEWNTVKLSIPLPLKSALYSCLNVSTTPLRQWGFRQCLPFSWTTLRGKNCRHPVAIMGVVDTFGPYQKHIIEQGSCVGHMYEKNVYLLNKCAFWLVCNQKLLITNCYWTGVDT